MIIKYKYNFETGEATHYKTLSDGYGFVAAMSFGAIAADTIEKDQNK